MNQQVYGYQMALISEVYLSTLSSIMKPYGIERYFYPLLFLCENSGKLTQKDLVVALRRDKVSVMRMVNYFCEKELLKRIEHNEDKRCQILEVTDKAIQLIPQIKTAVDQTNNLLLKNFSEEEKNQFMLGMEKLLSTIETLPEPDYIVKAVRRKNK
ncbi:MAG: MarR family transcriptional regulator [Flavobacteriales bacterium]|nr:MarR family transcriptional regulator [Flavobacteriales bacterium]MBX2959036.1 MarR family transcriptional regulator [Flavobacteriales bacterium]HRN41100.1 MarR family transcriptional regulator [Vicingus sp.]HRP60699.1 MarR family transcriptional regulator [Vicingus sp.]